MKETYRVEYFRFLSLFILSFVLFSLFQSTAYAQLCSKWSEGSKLGVLDHNQINEASGIETSRVFPDRLYHINDSGGGQYFYVTDLSGKNTQKISIEGESAQKSDFEDISVGKCLEKTCLFVADIGDNRKSKDSVEIIVIPELKNYDNSVSPIKRLKLVYPDVPHNAEGIAIHPNGDIYILTKEENLNDLEAYPAKLYRLEYDKWQNKENNMHILEYVSEIDLRIINPSGTAYGQVVSAFDIAPDGKKFLVLTYENAIEFNFDLSEQVPRKSRMLKRGKDYNVIELRSLPQQESISYLPDGKAFLYTTEFHWFEAPIIKVYCLKSN